MSVRSRYTTSFSTSTQSSNSKLFSDAQSALEQLLLGKKATITTNEVENKIAGNGITVGVGGFGLSGLPETLINALARNDHFFDLTIASLTASVDGFGIGRLLETKVDSDTKAKNKVKRIISSYVGENKVCQRT